VRIRSLDSFFQFALSYYYMKVLYGSNSALDGHLCYGMPSLKMSYSNTSKMTKKMKLNLIIKWVFDLKLYTFMLI
jgi:hypothetical protein